LLLVGGACAPGSDLAKDYADQRSAWGLPGKADDGSGGDSSADDPGTNKYLVQHGQGSLDEARSYYGLTLPGTDQKSYTLADWKRDVLSGPTVTGFYFNSFELGFWREMTCSTAINRGSGGCAVTNWKNETDRDRGLPNLGTVAMSISPNGDTQFFVFLPDGTLSPSALLDAEGPKFVPRLCTVCHGGVAGPEPGTSSNLGSIFREFQVSQLGQRAHITDAQQQQELYNLNQAIRQANLALRSEAEGGADGIDHRKAAMEQVVVQLYPRTQPPVARRVDDPALIPPSWQNGATADERAQKHAVWQQLVAPACMACHRHNLLDWSSYDNFSFLKTITGTSSLLEQYMGFAHDPARVLPVMPQEELAHEIVRRSDGVQSTIHAWAAAP
jgi:hypothetical protein